MCRGTSGSGVRTGFRRTFTFQDPGKTRPDLKGATPGRCGGAPTFVMSPTATDTGSRLVAPTPQTVRRQLTESTRANLLREKNGSVTANTILLKTEIQLMHEEILRLRQRIEELEQKQTQGQNPYRKLL